MKRFPLLTVLLVASLVACGDDDDAGAAGSSAAGTGGSGGSGGSSAAGGSGGSAGQSGNGGSSTGGSNATGGSGGSGATGGSNTTGGSAGNGGSGAIAGSGGSSAGSGGSAAGSGGSGGSGSGTPITEVTLGNSGATCFTFATGTSEDANPCNGDMVLLAGANVDLQSNDFSDMFCQFDGSYTTLESVPTDYSSCFFMPYVEGAVGLADTGFAVATTDGHHYRMQIVSNTLPTLQFRYDTID